MPKWPVKEPGSRNNAGPLKVRQITYATKRLTSYVKLKSRSHNFLTCNMELIMSTLQDYCEEYMRQQVWNYQAKSLPHIKISIHMSFASQGERKVDTQKMCMVWGMTIDKKKSKWGWHQNNRLQTVLERKETNVYKIVCSPSMTETGNSPCVPLTRPHGREVRLGPSKSQYLHHLLQEAHHQHRVLSCPRGKQTSHPATPERPTSRVIAEGEIERGHVKF